MNHNQQQRLRYSRFKDRYYKYVHCSWCGKQPIEYHHVIGEKNKNLAQLWSYKAETIRAEFKKCVPLCAGCHMIAHSMKTIKEDESRWLN